TTGVDRDDRFAAASRFGLLDVAVVDDDTDVLDELRRRVALGTGDARLDPVGVTTINRAADPRTFLTVLDAAPWARAVGRGELNRFGGNGHVLTELGAHATAVRRAARQCEHEVAAGRGGHGIAAAR